jgi:hypothetical protein
LEELTPGSRAYLAVKTKGNNSMPLKREMPEDVYGIDLQDPRDMAKAGLLELQVPAMHWYILRHNV